MNRTIARAAGAAAFFLAAAGLLPAQTTAPSWGFNVSPYVAVPVGATAVYLTPGGGIRAAGLGYLPGLNLGLGASVDYAILPLVADSRTISALASGLEVSSQFGFTQGFSAGLRAGGGAYYAWDNTRPDITALNGWLGVGGELTWAFGGGWALAFDTSYRQRISLNDEVTISLSIRNQPTALTTVTPAIVLPEGFVPLSRDRQGLQISGVKAPELFPVLAKSYETKPVVQLLFHNYETAAAEQLKLSVDWGLLGDGPKTIRVPDRLGPGLEVAVDLPLSWNSRFWTAPEMASVSGQLHLSFVQNSRPVKADLPLTIRVQPRSAAPPEAAAWPAFLSPKDPLLTAWTKASAAARATLKSPLPPELQTLLADQSGWVLLGLSAQPASEFVQDLRTTLKTRKGTARDLALAWAGLVEASGLSAALAVSGNRTLAAWSPDNPAQSLPWLPGAFTVKAGSRTWVVFDPAAQAWPVDAAQAGAKVVAAEPAVQIVPLREAWKAYTPFDPAGPPPDALSLPSASAWAVGLKSGADQWMTLGANAMVAGLQAQADAAAKIDQPALYNRLGVALGRLGRWSEAAEVLKKQASQGNRTALVNLGHVYLLSGQPKAALDPYQAALKVNAADSAVLTGLALSYRALGDAAMRKAAQTRLNQLDKGLGAQVAALKPVAAADAFQPGEMAQWQGWIVWRE